MKKKNDDLIINIPTKYLILILVAFTVFIVFYGKLIHLNADLTEPLLEEAREICYERGYAEAQIETEVIADNGWVATELGITKITCRHKINTEYVDGIEIVMEVKK